jgi:hypothetical protein
VVWAHHTVWAHPELLGHHELEELDHPAVLEVNSGISQITLKVVLQGHREDLAEGEVAEEAIR